MPDEAPLQFPYTPGHPYDDEVRGVAAVSVSPLLMMLHYSGTSRGDNRPPHSRGSPKYTSQEVAVTTPPVLHFGWYLKKGPLLKWAAENGIDTTMRGSSNVDGPVEDEPNSLFAVTTPEALAILAKKAGTPGLRLKLQQSARVGAWFLITITHNYRYVKDRKYITQARIDALDKYLKEHGIAVDSPAWHLDHKDFKWLRLY